MHIYVLRILGYLLYYVYNAHFVKTEKLLKNFLNNFIFISLARILIFLKLILQYIYNNFLRIATTKLVLFSNS